MSSEWLIIGLAIAGAGTTAAMIWLLGVGR